MARERLLLVDDSDMIRRVTSRILEEAGYVLSIARNGLEALDVLRNETPDLILSDINMPELDGLSFVDRLRHDSEFAALARTPVMMLTTETDPFFESEAKRLRVLAWLQKPYVPEELLAIVRKVLDHSVEGA